MSEDVAYFIVALGTNTVKIGHSDNPLARLRSMQTGNAAELSLVATAPGGRAAEVTYHNQFEDDWIRGEWFQLSRKILREIHRLGGALRAGEVPVPAREAHLREIANWARSSYEGDPRLSNLLDPVFKISKEIEVGREGGFEMALAVNRLAAAAYAWSIDLNEDVADEESRDESRSAA